MASVMTTSTVASEDRPSLTIERMAQSALDAFAPDDHWKVRPDWLLPPGSPVIKMRGELHVGATDAIKIVIAGRCRQKILDLDAAARHYGVIDYAVHS